jgi:hypothetical protein
MYHAILSPLVFLFLPYILMKMWSECMFLVLVLQMIGLKEGDERYPLWVAGLQQEMAENRFFCVPENQGV